MNHTRFLQLLLVGLLGSVTGTARADDNNVDLSTVPPRDTVQLTIYNSEDLTLVRETRHLTFARGVNPLQFSWAGTLIDPTSVDLRFKTHQKDLDVLDTTFPHDKPQMLYWNVRSRIDGDAVVEITYFTSGITWAADYVCVSDPGETEMSFQGFVRIFNHSGEDYEDARVRLVVGEINLVEKIAELARRGVISAETAKAFRNGRKRLGELEDDARREAGVELRRSMASAPAKPKEIIKEGLSEYFIYTIEGTETIPDTWSKRMRLFQGASVPFQVKYRHRPREYGDQLVRLFILRNDEESKLGSTPLPDGMVRLFRDNGRDGLSFLTAYQTRYVPIGQEIELNLGPDPEVIHERIRLRTWRDEFWFKETKGRRFFSPTQGRQVQRDYPVAGWDEHRRWVDRIRNYRGEPIDVEIRMTLHGDVTFDCDRDPTLHDYQTPQFGAVVPAGKTDDLAYEITYRNGHNKKQDRVKLP